MKINATIKQIIHQYYNQIYLLIIFICSSILIFTNSTNTSLPIIITTLAFMAILHNIIFKRNKPLTFSIADLSNSPATKILHDDLKPTISQPNADAYIGGQMFYIKRYDYDEENEVFYEDKLINTLLQPGGIITVRGYHQMGRTALLKYAEEVIKSKSNVVWINFKPLTTKNYIDLDNILKKMAKVINGKLGLDAGNVDNVWVQKANGVSSVRFTTYLEEYALHYAQETNKPLILIIDDVDTIFQYPFYDDFFQMVRTWSEEKGVELIYENLRIAMAISTTNKYLIEGPSSPFNVGKRIELRDFNKEEINNLNSCYKYPLAKQEIGYVEEFLNGHPYLTQIAMFTKKNHYEWSDIRTIALRKDGPFLQHLQKYLDILQTNPALKATMKQIITKNSSQSSFNILHSEKQKKVLTFELKNIRAVLIDGFTDKEIRRWLRDEDRFRPIYEQLATGMGKDEIIDRLIEYVDRQEEIELLLNLIEENNPAKYRKHQPYYKTHYTVPSSASNYRKQQTSKINYNQNYLQQLKKLGLIRRDINFDWVLRCQLYQEYFEEKL